MDQSPYTSSHCHELKEVLGKSLIDAGGLTLRGSVSLSDVEAHVSYSWAVACTECVIVQLVACRYDQIVYHVRGHRLHKNAGHKHA